MSKAKRRKVNQRIRSSTPVTLHGSQWDHGAMGQANRIGLVVEERGDLDAATGKRINPNNVKGARRVDMMEVYHARGWISKRGYTAGEMLRDAWENTQRGPGWQENERVQSSPKPDHAIAMQIDRISKLVWITRRVPKEHAHIIEHIAMQRCSIGGVRMDGHKPYQGANHEKGKVALHLAFEALADALGC